MSIEALYNNEHHETDDMEMPTPCQKCGQWFDLNDGYGSKKWYPNTVICEECHEVEEDEIDKDEEIQSLKEDIEEAEEKIENAKHRLKKLGVEV